MKKNNKKDPFDSLKSELKIYSKKGIVLSLHGRPSNPYDIVKAYKVAEEKSFFMRDYISDETGHVKEIDFRRINK